MQEIQNLNLKLSILHLLSLYNCNQCLFVFHFLPLHMYGPIYRTFLGSNFEEQNTLQIIFYHPSKHHCQLIQHLCYSFKADNCYQEYFDGIFCFIDISLIMSIYFFILIMAQCICSLYYK